jgi:hypothetical protein
LVDASKPMCGVGRCAYFKNMSIEGTQVEITRATLFRIRENP